MQQPNLFSPYADTPTTQRELFGDGPEEAALACDVCGRYLVYTQSGYLCCPRGHGKLICPESGRAAAAISGEESEERKDP